MTRADENTSAPDRGQSKTHICILQSTNAYQIRLKQSFYLQILPNSSIKNLFLAGFDPRTRRIPAMPIAFSIAAYPEWPTSVAHPEGGGGSKGLLEPPFVAKLFHFHRDLKYFKQKGPPL